MRKVFIFCCSHFHDIKIEKLKNIIPAGTGSKNFPSNWFSDKTGDNISHLNKTYAELTFHYWIWKNYLENFGENDLIGFCQYRRFWLKENHEININFDNLDNNLINENNLKNFDNEVFLTKSENIVLKKKSIFKYRSFFENITNPQPIFNRSYHTAGLQFEISTRTKKIIYEVARYLKKKDQQDYLEFLNTSKKVNFHNMFIAKKSIFSEYMNYLFEWLDLCDPEIKKINTDKHSSRRIHAFLAERFLHFWFNKNHKVKELPYIFLDTPKKF